MASPDHHHRHHHQWCDACRGEMENVSIHVFVPYGVANPILAGRVSGVEDHIGPFIHFVSVFIFIRTAVRNVETILLRVGNILKTTRSQK